MHNVPSEVYLVNSIMCADLWGVQRGCAGNQSGLCTQSSWCK